MLTRLRQRFQEWAHRNQAEIYDVRGFRVVVENTRPDIRTPDVLSRLAEAIDLIAQYQPWRLAHLRQDLQQFWVVRYPCRGAFFPGTRTCMTELTFLARRDLTAAPVAASILHEGMHARIHAMVVTEREEDLPRVERLCRRVELDFGESLPRDLGAPVIARAAETMALADDEVAPTIDWTEAERRQREVDRAALDRKPMR